MFLSVDRIENDLAVCEKEDMSFVNIPISQLPCGVKEGSIIKEDDGKYVIDEAEEEKRKERIMKLQNSIFKNKKNK